MGLSFKPLCHTKRHDQYIFTHPPTHPPKKSDWRLAWQNGYGRRPKEYIKNWTALMLKSECERNDNPVLHGLLDISSSCFAIGGGEEGRKLCSLSSLLIEYYM